MKTEIIYVEEETGANHNGKAFIGKGFYSKTGQSIYFNGNVYRKGKGFSSNYFDIETGIGFWISGVKKNGEDRHKYGKGLIDIDESIIDEYLKIIGETELPKNKFIKVKLDNVPAKEKATEILNESYEVEFDVSIRFKKKPNELTENELQNLIKYYEDLDFTKMFKKGRKGYIDSLNELRMEEESRRKKENYA